MIGLIAVKKQQQPYFLPNSLRMWNSFENQSLTSGQQVVACNKQGVENIVALECGGGEETPILRE